MNQVRLAVLAVRPTVPDSAAFSSRFADAAADLNVVTLVHRIRHQLRNDPVALADDPLGSSGTIQPVCGQARLNAVQEDLGPPAVTVGLDAQGVDFLLDSAAPVPAALGRARSRLSGEPPTMLSAPQVSMQAIGLRSEA